MLLNNWDFCGRKTFKEEKWHRFGTFRRQIAAIMSILFFQDHYTIDKSSDECRRLDHLYNIYEPCLETTTHTAHYVVVYLCF